MPTPITWKNINIPNLLSGQASAFEGIRSGVDAAGQNLQNIVKGQQDVLAFEKDDRSKANTMNLIGALENTEDISSLLGDFKQADIFKQYGDEVDTDLIRSTLKSRLTDTIDKQINLGANIFSQDDAFTDDLTKRQRLTDYFTQQNIPTDMLPDLVNQSYDKASGQLDAVKTAYTTNMLRTAADAYKDSGKLESGIDYLRGNIQDLPVVDQKNIITDYMGVHAKTQPELLGTELNIIDKTASFNDSLTDVQSMLTRTKESLDVDRSYYDTISDPQNASIALSGEGISALLGKIDRSFWDNVDVPDVQTAIQTLRDKRLGSRALPKAAIAGIIKAALESPGASRLGFFDSGNRVKNFNEMAERLGKDYLRYLDEDAAYNQLKSAYDTDVSKFNTAVSKTRLLAPSRKKASTVTIPALTSLEYLDAVKLFRDKLEEKGSKRILASTEDTLPSPTSGKGVWGIM